MHNHNLVSLFRLKVKIIRFYQIFCVWVFDKPAVVFVVWVLDNTLWELLFQVEKIYWKVFENFFWDIVNVIWNLVVGKLLEVTNWNSKVSSSLITIFDYYIGTESSSWEKLPKIEKLCIDFYTFIDMIIVRW